MSKSPSKRVTIYDIARQMHVSPMAVSLALRGEAGVSRATREEARRIAAEMGYAPKIAAQMLRTGKTGFIGLLLGASTPAQLQGFHIPLMGHFLQECQEAGQRYVVNFLSPASEEIYVPPQQITGGLLDGVILAGYVNKGLRQWLASPPAGLRMPWVGIDEPSTDCVMSATDVGIQAALKMLRELGHSKIAYWCGPRQFSVHRIGYQAFIDAVVEGGIETCAGRWIHGDEFFRPSDTVAESAESQARWARQMLEEVPGIGRPTAFLCQSLTVAREVIRAAEQCGLNVPLDVSVVGLGNPHDAEFHTPGITSIEPDYRELVRCARVRLNELINGDGDSPPMQSVIPRLIIRQTSAKSVS